MRICPNCGAKSDSNFCPDCGTDLKNCYTKKLCPVCGTEVKTKFCMNCGRKVNLEEVYNSYSSEEDIAAEVALDEGSQGASISNHKKRFYKETWFAILMLIVLFPVGLYLVWKHTTLKKDIKVVATIVATIVFVIGIVELSYYWYDDGSSYNQEYEYECLEDFPYDYNEEFVDSFTTESDYTLVSYDNLARTPDAYEYTKVQGTGTVIQVIEGEGETDLRIALNDDYGAVVWVFYDSDIVTSRVLQHDNVTYYGTSYGLFTYESTMGVPITVPLIEVHKIVQN